MPYVQVWVDASDCACPECDLAHYEPATVARVANMLLDFRYELNARQEARLLDILDELRSAFEDEKKPSRATAAVPKANGMANA
jgi:hypothetical protein